MSFKMLNGLCERVKVEIGKSTHLPLSIEAERLRRRYRVSVLRIDKTAPNC